VLVRCELRLGRWQDALRRVTCDTLITDPPFTARTASGYRSGSAVGSSIELGYDTIEPRIYCRFFVRAWRSRVRRWFVIFSDHVAAPHWLEALEAADLYTFPPVIWAKTNGAPRFMGDGPSSQVEQILVARQRIDMPRRYRPGYYLHAVARGAGLIGSKPLGLVRQLVRDYSEPGDRICDPHAGLGTSLLAARLEQRASVGAEAQRATYYAAQRRLSDSHHDLDRPCAPSRSSSAVATCSTKSDVYIRPGAFAGRLHRGR
jgi:site-specific DNA-methyltransferase (adenine-specific)